MRMKTNNQGSRYMGLVTVYLRIALGIGFLLPLLIGSGSGGRQERRTLRGAISTASWLTQRSSILDSLRVGFQPLAGSRHYAKFASV